MKFWRSEFPNSFYDLNYEELVTDQEKETKELIHYLGLDFEAACLEPHKNSRSVQTASQQQVREKIYKNSSKAWEKYEDFIGDTFKLL